MSRPANATPPRAAAARRAGFALCSTIAVTLVLITGCSTEKEPSMSPIEARDQVIALMLDTVETARSSGWVVQPVIPKHCDADGAAGVAFSVAVYTQTLGADAAADAQRVAELWQTKGLTARVVEEPRPVVFASGGGVSAASFATAPTYAISIGGLCVPGEPRDYNDLPLPTLPAGLSAP